VSLGDRDFIAAASRRAKAFSGKVDPGFPSENAITIDEIERFPIQFNQEAL
jgi:hypothetical protein